MIHRDLAAVLLLIAVPLLFAGPLFFAGPLSAQESETCSHPELRRELLERMERDQAIRKSLINKSGEAGKEAFNADPGTIGEMMKVDRENREWLAEQIEQAGWPGKSKVGKDGAHAAWLLVQHADQDRQFQQRCLDLMQEAGSEEVSGVDIAYLTDRVLVGQGKPQRYGTQVGMVDGQPKVNECEDPDNLDARRAELGMGPISEYLDRIREAYGLEDK